MKVVQGRGLPPGWPWGPILGEAGGTATGIHLDTCLDPQQELKRLQAAQQQVIPDLEVEGKSPAAGGEEEAAFLKSIR